MNSKILIGIVGLPASGKSTAIEAVKDLGTIIIMGDVIREETKKRSLEPTPINIGKIAKKLREEFGKGIIAQRCLEKIQDLDDKVILIDGIRSEEEVELFRDHYTLYIIAIICSNSERFDRIRSRGRSDDTIDMDQIKERDMRELEFGIGNVIEHANYTIPNTANIESLIKRVRNLVRGLL
jgi:dephospho-CoA kinase